MFCFVVYVYLPFRRNMDIKGTTHRGYYAERAKETLATVVYVTHRYSKS